MPLPARRRSGDGDGLARVQGLAAHLGRQSVHEGPHVALGIHRPGDGPESVARLDHPHLCAGRAHGAGGGSTGGGEGATTGAGHYRLRRDQHSRDRQKEKTEGPPGGGLDIEKIINNPNLTNEQKQQILQQLIQQQQGGGEGPHGALEVESTDTPAGWFADGNGAGGGGSATAAAGSAANAGGSATTAGSTAKAGAGSATAAAGSAGNAGSAVAAGSASGSGQGSAAPAAPTVSDANTPSKDQLPAMAEVEKAHVARFGPSPRSSKMPGLGASKEAQQAVYDELQPGMLGKQVYEADGNYIILQLIQREKPDVTEFDKDADARVSQLRERRAGEFLNDWLKERCESLAKDGKIRANPDLLADHDDQGRLIPTQYKPCISFR